MTAIIQKLTAEKVKHHLEINIHYIRIKLAEPCPLIIEVQRGKKMRQETQQQSYSPNTAFVQFDYPISFDITMHKKGEKYVKKYFVIRLFQVIGKNRVSNGQVKIDFSQIPVLKKPIIRREVGLSSCTDNSAVVNISVKLEQLTKKPDSKCASPNSSLLTPSQETKKPEEPKNKKVVAKDPLAVEVASESSRRSSQAMDLDDVHDAYHNEQLDDSINSKMSFSDLIVNPRTSEVESESSSSEEEVKEVPVNRLVANAMPKTNREQITPNEGSKEDRIRAAEEKSGIVTRREGNCCSACEVF